LESAEIGGGGMRVVVDSAFNGEIMEREGLMVGMFCVRYRL